MTDLAARGQAPEPQHAAPPATMAAARDFILRSYDIAVGRESVAVSAALGAILAEDVIADVDLPRFDAAAMDGYAIVEHDFASGVSSRLRISGRSAAGHPPQTALRSGEAMRIFTGAMVPEGAGFVIMQEDCMRDGDFLAVKSSANPRRNIRRKGEDVAMGSVALRRGTRLTAGHLALASALHRDRLSVHRRLRVALFSTGDELRAPGEPIGPGQIADANRPFLRAMLAGMDCAVHDGGILRDNPDAQIAALMAAAANDLIVTSGGASVGEEDHLARVIRRRGHLEVWRLKIKPGKPVGLGDIDDCPILALPGNPVAAAMNLLMLGTPLIARLSGNATTQPLTLRLPLAQAMSKRPGRWEAILGHFVQGPDGATGVAPETKTGSAMLSALAAAQGFIILPEAIEEAEAGDLVDFALLRAPYQVDAGSQGSLTVA